MSFTAWRSREEHPENKREYKNGKHFANEGAVAADASVVSAAATSEGWRRREGGGGGVGQCGEGSESRAAQREGRSRSPTAAAARGPHSRC